MGLLTGVAIALGNLRSNKLRTFLTLLGNIVGTMSVIAVVSLIYGIDRYTREVVLDEGTGVFSITRIDNMSILSDFEAFLKSLGNPNLTLEDRDYLADRLELASRVGASLSGTATLRAGSRDFRGARVRGKTGEYADLEELPLAVGRHLNRSDIVASRPVAVLGSEVAEELFPRLLDPTGREFRLGDRHFTVAGVVESRSTVMGNNRNRFVIIPITAWQKVFGADNSIEIKIEVADLELMEEAQAEAAFHLRKRHRLRPAEVNDFAVQDAQQLLSIWAGISKAIYAALVPLVGISLVVGGIVLMNIMLVSVTERTREVGVRKAIGASRMTIMRQFLVESVTLSVTGGLIGIGLGYLLAFLIAVFSPLSFAFAPWAMGLGLGVTFVIGIVFGTFPAWRAAGLDPVEALRYE